jgi:hypothetical protein
MPASSPTRNHGVSIAASLLSVLLIAPGVSAQGSGWPRQFDSTSGSFIVYQPQPEQLTGNMVTARAAFSLQKSDTAVATFGVLWFQAHVQVDRDSSTVTESDLDVTLVRLPGASPAEAKRYEHLVEAEATGWDLSGSVEELQAGLAASAKEQRSIEDLDHTPPHILFSTKRALLVLYDGQPQLGPIEGSRLQRVVNTPCAVVFDSVGAAYYLNGANLWYRASEPLGPWSVISAPPADVAAVVPPDSTASDQVEGVPPVVVTATEPTELVVTDGEPLLEPLVGKELFYVTNTEGDVLRDAKTASVYVLLSGRWYTARALDDPWVYIAADSLPAVFSRIPADSPKGNLLASVAGTEESDNAVADDQIPQTSAISRDNHDVWVEWDGQPQFEVIPGTTLQFGVNTDSEVLLAGGRYYLCDQGVWYVAGDPNGPWAVSIDRPDGLADLSPSCPVYNVRYVDIYSVTPDMVQVGYLPGYLGYYPCRGTIVYGTGYRYRPWRSRHHYYPRPCTWGFNARYNPWLSRWSFGISYWSGFMRVGLRWQQTPAPGLQQHRYSPWLGPGGYRRPLFAANRTMMRVQPARAQPRILDLTPMNLYARSWNAGRVAKPGGRAMKPGFVGAGRKARVPDDVFAGRDGKVYQRVGGGEWKVNQAGRWKPTPTPVAPATPVTPAGSFQRPRVQPAPMPVMPSAPAERRPGPGQRPSQPPAPMPVVHAPARPQPASSPGVLERDFRARERTKEPAPPPPPAARPEAPRPAPAPHAAPAPKQEKPNEGRGAQPKKER